LEDHDWGVEVVVFSPNGELLATAGYGKKIEVYSVANDFSRMHTMEGHMEGHTNMIWSLSFSSDNPRLVSGCNKGSIRLWNSTEGTLLKTVNNAHSKWISAVAHSPNGNLLASGSRDSTIKIWDAKTLKLKFAIDDAHSNGARDLSFTPTAPFLLSASWDTTVKVIKIALLESYERRDAVLLAYLRFSDAVHNGDGLSVKERHTQRIKNNPFEALSTTSENEEGVEEEEECDDEEEEGGEKVRLEVRKLKNAGSAYATKFAGGLLQCALTGGGPKGVLGVILSYV